MADEEQNQNRSAEDKSRQADGQDIGASDGSASVDFRDGVASNVPGTDKPAPRRDAGDKRAFDPNIGKATQFPKGTSGNPSGVGKNDLAKQLAQACFEAEPEEVKRAYLQELKKGNVKAFQALADRGYGKVAQQVELTGANGSPLTVTVLDDILSRDSGKDAAED